MALFFSRPPVLDKESPARALNQIVTLFRLGFVLCLIMIAIWLIGEVLTILFASCLLAIVLHGVARLIRRRLPFIPYPAAVGIVAIIIFGLLTALIWGNGPAIADQFVSLKEALIAQASDLHLYLAQNSFGRMILDHLPASLGGTDKGGTLSNLGFGIAGSVTGLLSSALGLIGTLFVVMMSAFYFAISPSLYINGFLRLVPPNQRSTTRDLLFTAGSTLWAWTAGQALDMLVIGLLSGIGLSLIGMPLAPALGVVAGLCNFIPYIGAILGAVPALLISLSLGTREAFFVAILYSVIQFFEGNVLAPLIQRRAVHMPPAMAILSQTVFGSILGVPGLVLASPITAALLAVLDKATPPLHDADSTRRAVDEINEEELAAQKIQSQAQSQPEDIAEPAPEDDNKAPSDRKP